MTQIPKPLAAVIFDLDGTLIDTAEEFVVVVQALRAEHSLEAMDAELIRANVSNGARVLTRLALGLEESSPEFDRKWQRLLTLYSEIIGTSACLYPGVQQLIETFAKRGIAWGIATNKPRAYTEPLLKKLNLSPAPGSVVCPDDVTDRKPHPESLYLNCRELNCLPAESIYVGDHRRDIEAGRHAGMYTVAAAYGYIEDHDDPTTWGASATVNDSNDLQALLLDD
ncbi:MAG: 2-phosphoglycolate phosphatase [Halieaceae bacterium]|jgi:2-phosphoglycolate phosphatase